MICIEAKWLIRALTVFTVLCGTLFAVAAPTLAQTKEPPPPTSRPKPAPPPTPATSSPTEQPSQPPAPTPTPVPPTSTNTAVPPTDTPTPTNTVVPPTDTPTSTDTPAPTHVPTSTSTPSPTPTESAFSLISLPPLSSISLPLWGVPGLAAGVLIGIFAILLARRWRSEGRSTPHRPVLPLPGIPETIGRYEMRELLGGGEATTTRMGFDPVLQRDVVVKLLHPHLLGTSAARRMEREGRALARLDHPAIPGVIEIIREPGVLALVEEYVAGEPLAHVLAERGSLDLTETLPIVRTVASALDHAHQNDVVHHDVKPSNVLIAEGQRAYLLNFGLAAFYDDKTVKALTPQGELLGTAAYMSPEQIRGKRGDHRSDVYSLGILLYEMLTGESPFDAGAPHETQSRQINEEPPERPLEGLPKPVQAVVKKALRKAPKRRYQSPGELADALEKAASAAAASGSTRADAPRKRVTATIHTDQVFLVQREQPAGAPSMPAVIDEQTSRVLAKDKEACSLQVYAFGGGRVVRDGCAVSASGWGGLKREMFFYILLHGPLSRDGIGVVFWPDSDAEQVESNVHSVLHRIRKAVGTDAVVEEERRYRIGDIGYWFDVEELEALVKQARFLRLQGRRAEQLWERAVALYGGDFLPEVDRAWCVPRREMLREMYVEALVEVGRCYEERAQFEGALVWYRRALEVNGLREDAHRGVMRCYFEAGRRSEALVQYRRCEEILEEELGVEPAAETMELYERMVARRGD